MQDTIAVIPTRGLIYAQTIEGLKRNGITDFIMVEGLGIPDCHNEAVFRALKEYSGYILFVEEDMVMPDNALAKMKKMDSPIVAVEYPMDNGYTTVCKKGGEVMWCGLGCTLIKRGVFTAMEAPWFRTDHSWRIVDDEFNLEKIDNPNKYGGHDINFCMKARELGFKIEVVPQMEAKHLRYSNERSTRSNNSQYGVYALPSISHRQDY